MKRRDFLKAMSAVFGASVLPAALANTIDSAIPDVVSGAPLDATLILNSISIGGMVTNFDGSIVFPKGCRPEFSFKSDHVLIGAEGVTLAMIGFQQHMEAPVEMYAQWYEVDSNDWAISPKMKIERFEAGR